MAYRVEMSERAERDRDAIFVAIEADTSDAAYRWFNRFEELILSLEEMPDRGTLVLRGRGLRQLIYGNKPYFYRVLYRVSISDQVVHILHIRHGRRKGLGIR